MPSSAQLRKRIWGDECVVFNPLSGNTHLLNPIADAALVILEASPTSAEELANRIASDFNVAADADLFDLMSKLLEECDEMGLIEVARQ